jgi:hypothetical protein
MHIVKREVNGNMTEILQIGHVGSDDDLWGAADARRPAQTLLKYASHFTRQVSYSADLAEPKKHHVESN